MRYLIARIVQGFISLIGVTMIVFFLPALYNSPIALAIRELGPKAKHYELVAWVKSHGFDKPLVIQYFHWLNQAIHGNFGISYFASSQFHVVSVDEVVGGALLRSLWLTLIPTILSVLIAIPIGLTQAVRRNHIYDHAMTTIVYVLYSTPTVLVCVLTAYYLGISFHIGGFHFSPVISQDAQNIPPHQFPVWMLEHLSQFVLPYTAIIVLSVGGLTRFMRGSALDTLVQDHVRTARAKGASPSRVLFRHVLRPSLIPMITIIGLAIPGIIGGALIVEEVFSFPGMGVLAVNSVFSDDFTVVMAITLFTAFLTIMGNFLADVFVAIADPRVRLGASR